MATCRNKNLFIMSGVLACNIQSIMQCLQFLLMFHVNVLTLCSLAKLFLNTITTFLSLSERSMTPVYCLLICAVLTYLLTYFIHRHSTHHNIITRIASNQLLFTPHHNGYFASLLNVPCHVNRGTRARHQHVSIASGFTDVAGCW